METMGLEALERRVLMSAAAPPADGATHTAQPLRAAGASTAAAATAAPAVTLADRWDLLAHWQGPIAKSLKYRLRAGDAAGFDQMLLDYMVNRTGPHYYFDPKDVPAYVSLIRGDTGSRANLARVADAQVARADDTLAHLFPEQANSGGNTVQLPLGTIDWDAQPTGLDAPDFLHTLNTHTFWEDLAVAYRMTDDRRYARELCAQLGSWFAQNPPLKNPDDWSNVSPRWWLLDTARRVDHWTRSYFLLLGTRGLTPEANTLFLAGLQRHADFLNRVTPRSTASNWTVTHGAALTELATVFPEFTGATAWADRGGQLMLGGLERQFHADGGHVEQSPSYAVTVLATVLQQGWLSRLNGGALWTRRLRLRLAGAVEALYQLTTPRNTLPPLSDTYRESPARAFFTQASVVLDQSRYRLQAPSFEDAWLFGPAVVGPRLNDGIGAFVDRGAGYALPDAGYHLVRAKATPTTGTDGQPHTRDLAQLILDAGPTGGTHGHYDLLSFDLSSDGGGALISDPGPARYGTSAERRRVVSTPAHNTISIDGMSHAPVEDAHDRGIAVDRWEIADDHALVTAHHHAYGGFKGSPVVGRSIWFDRSRTDFSAMVIVDWGQASATHTFTTSLNVGAPLTKIQNKVRGGLMHVRVGSYTLRVQPVLLAGQSVTVAATATYPDPPPTAGEPAIRYAVSQTGHSAVFVTLVAKEADDLTGMTATLDAPLRAGRAVRVRLHQDGQPDRVIAIAPPDLTPLAASAPPVTPADVPAAAPPRTANRFSTMPVSAALFGERAIEPLADVLR